jgi:Chromatin associated protein KTI12
MVRWDSPLFTIPWSESDMPMDSIWKAVTEGNVKPPNFGTQAVGDLPCPLEFSDLLTFYVLPRCQRRLLMRSTPWRVFQRYLFVPLWQNRGRLGFLVGVLRLAYLRLSSHE